MREDDESLRTAPVVRREHGLTLVEMLITVAIMGLAISGLVASMTSTVTVSRLVDERASVQSEARRLAEIVRSYDMPFPDCATAASDYQETLDDNHAAGFTATVGAVEWGVAQAGGVEFSGLVCGGTPAPSIHRIEIVVTPGSGAVETSIRVVKRDTDAAS